MGRPGGDTPKPEAPRFSSRRSTWLDSEMAPPHPHSVSSSTAADQDYSSPKSSPGTIASLGDCGKLQNHCCLLWSLPCGTPSFRRWLASIHALAAYPGIHGILFHQTWAQVQDGNQSLQVRHPYYSGLHSLFGSLSFHSHRTNPGFGSQTLDLEISYCRPYSSYMMTLKIETGGTRIGSVECPKQPEIWTSS